MNAPSSFAVNLARIRQEMEALSARWGRKSEDITLLAVSKTQKEDALKEALAAGMRSFGENRVQEAQKKWPALKALYPDIRLHLIGPLQSNKAIEAVRLFDVIESVDRLSLVDALVKAMEKEKKTPTCHIQVNIGEEPQKSGVYPDDVHGLVTYCNERGLKISGLMCIPPMDKNPAPYFALLHSIAERYDYSHLSMGMSHDYPIAIQMGSTEVRIGTALFGERQTPPR